MKERLEKWTGAGFLLALALISGLGVINYQSTREFMASTDQRMQARRLLVGLKNLFDTLQDAETSQRGYMLTGNEEYLRFHSVARAAFPQRLEQVLVLLEGHPNTARDIEKLRPLLDDKMVEMHETIEARKNVGLDAALAIIKTDRGLNAMLGLRRIIASVEDDVVVLLEARARLASESAQHALLSMVAGGVGSMAVLLWIYILLMREMAGRRRAALDLRESNERLEQRVSERTAELRESEGRFRTFIDHTPAAAFLKDEAGRYVLGNLAWAAQFGRRQDELVGKTDFELWPEAVARKFQESDHAAWNTGRPVEFDECGITADGRTRCWTVFKFPVQVAPGRRLLGGVALDVTRLMEADQKIRQINAELEQRVTERTAELQSKNRELETFSYSVSHDLKAPLRGIDGYSRLLLEDYSDKLDDEGRTFLRNIRQGAEQMQRLIEDLLAYSKLERRELLARCIDLRPLVGSILAERSHDLEGTSLTVDLNGGSVLADPEGLTIAVRNLIDNAAKFTRHQPAPRIEIRSQVEQDRCIFSVRDNGIGFDMKYHDLIFQIFHRLHRAEDYSGTGVGLAIVRRAMERMGGRVWAESREGAGAVFFLDLPLDNGKKVTINPIKRHE